MVSIIKEENSSSLPQFYTDFLDGKRQLTENEIEELKKTNRNSDPTWKNIWVDENDFDAGLIQNCQIFGFFVVGKLRKISLKYHDLVLASGFYDSYLENVVVGDDSVIRNVNYLSNYKIGSHDILFNITEMSCTVHSKFGNGILKMGEPESNRIWIGVGNENDGRAILPFEEMIPADAFIWSKYRGDQVLQRRFLELTEENQPVSLDTFGTVADDVVIKNTTLLKDVKIGQNAYIKGAFKLKNITVLSSVDEPSQIGEGVELVNGILGYGSKVFYQAVAVRFVIGRNCQLKYGARLLNSVLGDNSTVSCCELLNNLIFPFHEQHHNSSFLIASTVCGQSNIASNATIGSNHNSRSPDGEMFAGRGFWPGLCTDFKFNSKFASFVLVAKGSYQHELNIAYPFALVCSNGDMKPVNIIPAYSFLYNMYSVARNKSKFQKRDKRVVKIQHIETDPLAPDTMQEVEAALRRIIELTRDYLLSEENEKILACKDDKEALYQTAKDFLHQNPNANFTLKDCSAQKKYGAVILKHVKAYREYLKIAKYFDLRCLVEYCQKKGKENLSKDDFDEILQIPLYTKWVNAGGQIIPEKKIRELFGMIKEYSVQTWSEVHKFYDDCENHYEEWRLSYALNLLEKLYSRPVHKFTREIFKDIEDDVSAINNEMYESTLISRMKDFDDDFRMLTFDNSHEMNAVIGSFEDNEFIYEMKPQVESFEKSLHKIFANLD